MTDLRKTTTYRAPSSGWKVMIGILLVLLAGCVVLLVLEPRWPLAITTAGLLLQVLFWLGRRPGWVEVSDTGLRLRSQGTGVLRPLAVPWEDVREVRRPRWNQALVLDLASGRELTLPELPYGDRTALLADVEERLRVSR